MTSLCTYTTFAAITYLCPSLNEGGVKSGSLIRLCEYSAFLLFCIVLNKETADIMLCWLVRHADPHFFLFAYKTNRESHDVDFFCFVQYMFTYR